MSSQTEQLAQRLDEAEKKIGRLETILYAAGAVAVAFGLSGGWAYSAISWVKEEVSTTSKTLGDEQTKLTELTATVNGLDDEFANLTDAAKGELTEHAIEVRSNLSGELQTQFAAELQRIADAETRLAEIAPFWPARLEHYRMNFNANTRTVEGGNRDRFGYARQLIPTNEGICYLTAAGTNATVSIDIVDGHYTLLYRPALQISADTMAAASCWRQSKS